MYVKIDLQKITENARTITNLCAARGITVIGATKGCCGMPEVARAILTGGVGGLADSRLSNLRRMKEAGIKAHTLLLRSPALSETTEAVELADVSLNSELEIIASLAQKARALGKLHQIVLMVDVGGRREGLLPEDVESAVQNIEGLEGIRLIGLGSQIGCLSGARPSLENTRLLVQLASQVEKTIGRELAVISGGSSIHLRMVEQNRLPARINQLRIGEGILLDSDPADGRPLAGTSQDAFTLTAEVIEVKWKPTRLKRERGHSAPEERLVSEDPALRCQAILPVGTQDVRIEGLAPRTPGATIIGASSDHLVLDATARPVKVGDQLVFDLRYPALMTTMASPYVRKEILSTAVPDPL